MKKQNAKKSVATSATAKPELTNEVAVEIEEIEAVTEQTSTVTVDSLRIDAEKLREQAKSMLPDLDKIEVSKLDSAKLKQLSSEIATSEKLEKQAEKLEKQANTLAKSAMKAQLLAVKANEVKDNEKHLVVCEQIAVAEREFIAFQAANDKIHQAATWAFNGLTDTDFLTDREANAETIEKFQSVSDQLDEFNELTASLVKQSQDKMRALHIANPEAVASSQMKRARKELGIKASAQMQSIVNGEEIEEIEETSEISEAMTA